MVAKDDLKFNRITKFGKRKYLTEFSNGHLVRQKSFTGFIKCKLVHNDTYSLVFPDQVYVDFGGDLRWFQPLYFDGCKVVKLDDPSECHISINISHGFFLKVKFSSEDVVHRLEDCSFVYKCELNGPIFLYKYATGLARMEQSGPAIKLFHHTNRGAKENIKKSCEFWSSAWNIQGTKKLVNIAYLYLTSLPAIECVEDLGIIAMSSVGRLEFRTDNNVTGTSDLTLKVYRESTSRRTEVLSYWISAAKLAAQSAYRHRNDFGSGYHEVVCPFVHRIGVDPHAVVAIDGDHLEPRYPKKFDYVIVGNATKIDGLAAPYDEEDTNDILKIECISSDADIISFWFDNANSDQFSVKSVEEARLTHSEM